MTESRARRDFTGLWEANLEKSSLRGRPPRQILVKIEHREPRLVQMMLVTDVAGSEERFRLAYTTDAEESINLIRGIPCTTHAQWDGEELVIDSVMKTPDREFHFKDHWSLSADGRTLTMAHRDDDLAGQTSVLEEAAAEAAMKFSGW